MMLSIRPLGDSAAILQWADANDEDVCHAIRRATDALNRVASLQSDEKLIAVVPAFHSITVHYCPSRMKFEDAARIIKEATVEAAHNPTATRNQIEIPVCFAADFAPDLWEVARAHKLRPGEVIQRFCSRPYLVRMIGFSPGFPYLSGLPPDIATPRRSTPRLKVPQGSVAIGGRQAGIYSQETPGGWNIIGRTPRRLFRAELSPPCLLNAGDEVRFVQIHEDQFHEYAG